MQNRNVFLFGAGAALAWGAPSTTELTSLARQSGFNLIDQNQTVTEFIYRRLITNGFAERDINFETLINVIEELIVYFAQFNSEKSVPSLLNAFFTPKDLDPIFNFDIVGQEKHGYTLNIPKGKKYNFSDISYHQETPKQFYLQHLLSEILTNICARITEYTVHVPHHSCIFNDAHDTVNAAFTNWMDSLAANSILRLYTLNYDRTFKVLLEHHGIPVFEGFDCGEFIDHQVIHRANIQKIFGDTQCHCHYNLHGSAFWELLALDHAQLPNPELVLRAYPNLPINFEQSHLQIEKGKTFMVTNIITGYQKTQKTILPPFRQMQAAFDRDCCSADNLYIVGYGFGDEHINMSIKTAIRYNPNMKVVIVDPSFITNNMDEHFALHYFPFRDLPPHYMHPKKVSANLYSYFDGTFKVHTLSFQDFLTNVVA